MKIQYCLRDATSAGRRSSARPRTKTSRRLQREACQALSQGVHPCEGASQGSFLSQKSPETGIAVQLCGQVARPPRQLVEAVAGGDDDEDGGAGTRIHEEQATRGGAEELDRPKAQPSQVSNSMYTKKSSQHKKTQHTNPATSGRSSMLKSLPLPLLPKLMPGWHSP